MDEISRKLSSLRNHQGFMLFVLAFLMITVPIQNYYQLETADKVVELEELNTGILLELREDILELQKLELEGLEPATTHQRNISTGEEKRTQGIIQDTSL